MHLAAGGTRCLGTWLQGRPRRRRAQGRGGTRKRIAEVDVKIAALEAIIDTLAKPLEELDAGIETELTRLAMIIAKHLVRRELKIDPTQVIGIIRHTVGLLPLAARNIKIHLHPDDAAIVREQARARRWASRNGSCAEDPLMARGGCRVTTDNSQHRRALRGQHRRGDARPAG